MMKLQFSVVITIILLYTMTLISSTSKDHEVGGKKNSQNMEKLLNLHQNQSQYEQNLQDTIEKVPKKTSQYTGVCWHTDNKKWQAHLMHNKKNCYGGSFDHEKLAAMSVNLLCDKYEIARKNPMINIKADVIQQVPNQTSKYTGVCWHKDSKKWQSRLLHKKKMYYGGYFDNEEHAAMKVNLLCDQNGMERKNPMIIIKPDLIQQLLKNQTSIYNGVCWHKDAKKWQARLMHNKKSYLGGLFDDEKQAAMSVNLLCDKYGKERKNPMIKIELDAIQQVPNPTSKYTGVYFHKATKKWRAQLMYNTKRYFGGYFDNEEQAAMGVNLLCDKYKMARKNPMIIIESDAMKQLLKNQTSIYTGVCWHKDAKKWQAKLGHNKKSYLGGLFDNEEQAAMQVNLLCDKNGIERKNPMIIIEPDEIQQVPNQPSKYTGVCWHKPTKKWRAQLMHNKKRYFGGYFDNEEQAAMGVNLLCDKNGIAHKNQMIVIESDVNKEIKVEDVNMLEGFKNKCENRFMKSNDKESFVTIGSGESQKRKRKRKRKRKEEPIMDDVIEEKVEIITPNHDDNKLVEKIQKYQTQKKQD